MDPDQPKQNNLISKRGATSVAWSVYEKSGMDKKIALCSILFKML